MRRQRTRTARLTTMDPKTVAFNGYTRRLTECKCKHGMHRGGTFKYCGSLACAGCVVCARDLCKGCARWLGGMPLCRGCRKEAGDTVLRRAYQRSGKRYSQGWKHDREHAFPHNKRRHGMAEQA